MKTYIMTIKDGYGATNRFRITSSQLKVVDAIMQIDGVLYDDIKIDFMPEEGDVINDLTKE